MNSISENLRLLARGGDKDSPLNARGEVDLNCPPFHYDIQLRNPFPEARFCYLYYLGADYGIENLYHGQLLSRDKWVTLAEEHAYLEAEASEEYLIYKVLLSETEIDHHFLEQQGIGAPTLMTKGRKTRSPRQAWEAFTFKVFCRPEYGSEWRGAHRLREVKCLGAERISFCFRKGRYPFEAQARGSLLLDVLKSRKLHALPWNRSQDRILEMEGGGEVELKLDRDYRVWILQGEELVEVGSRFEVGERVLLALTD